MKLFNTLSGTLEEFKPLRDGEVRLYTCGPTVYDFAHIGNFRTFVFEDLLRRLFEFQGFEVKHVMNVTDVDDKTIAGAGRERKSLSEFTEPYTRAFLEDLNTLNILPPNTPADPPRATREIPAMIELIERLVKKGAAYVSEGSVYYRVSAFPAYGRLSKKNLEKNIRGARVDVDEYDKEEGADFALWKGAKELEPAWDSPWGKGRPGWHIECSAMSMKYLGETFDLHAGGEDLIFPHHENEIAQSEAATGEKFVRFWLHAKHLLVNGEKMSKSKGNFYTLRDLLAKGCDPMAIRYALLSVHYRTPLNFTLEGLKEMEQIVTKVRDCYWRSKSLRELMAEFPDMYDFGIDEKAIESGCENLKQFLPEKTDKIVEHLSNDLNISEALAELHEGVREINVRRFNIEEEHLDSALRFFEDVDKLFGLGITVHGQIPKEILTKLHSVFILRKEGNFKQAADIREEIFGAGWQVQDGRPGEPSTVKKKRREQV
jgi:cysteinyl-tRNA synthetase